MDYNPYNGRRSPRISLENDKNLHKIERPFLLILSVNQTIK